jgi:hypothetical protein
MMTEPPNEHDDKSLVVLTLVFVMLITTVFWLGLALLISWWWQALPSHQVLPVS